MDAIREREAYRKNTLVQNLSLDKQDFTSAKFIEYYTNRFMQDLHMFYDISNDFDDESYPFVLMMQDDGIVNKQRRKIKWENMTHFYMFSVSVVYISLCTQIIGRLYGWNQMKNFMRASGWPMLSCGMGGFMHPIVVISDSELFPPKDLDFYLYVLDIAGDYISKDFLDFFDGKSANLNRTAYISLCDKVWRKDIAKELKARVEEYKQWIADPTTEYSTFYLTDPIDRISMIGYLKHYKEDMPDWLKKYKPDDRISFDMVMSSKIGYYPGSGHDGHLVATANQAHCVHSYLYVDYGVQKEDLINELDNNAFRGYHSIGRIDWKERDIMPMGQYPLNINVSPRCNSMMFVRRDAIPYCFTEILERNPEMGEDWGAKRFAITFLFADGIATYYQLFVKHYAKAPWLFLLQDHGFGGNYNRFGRGGLLSAIIHDSDIRPEFVICDQEETNIWRGYRQIDNVENSFGGMHHHERGLYIKIP